VTVHVVVYLVIIYQQETAMKCNCIWYELAGSMYGYLEWGTTDSVVYYSRLLNHDRLQTLMLHGFIPWFSRLLLIQ